MRRVERICAYWIAAMVTSTVAMLASGQQQQTSAQTAQSPVLPEVTLQVLPQRVSAPGPLVSTHDLRVAKCELIARELYPDSGFLPYCEFFVSEYERLGMGDDWQMGLAYCAAGISLRCHYRARNGCAGPTDIPGGSTDPKRNIRAHCREWHGFYKRGIVGYAVAKRVFYPKRPHDWLPGRSIKHMHRTQKHGRIWQAYLRHKQVIEGAYRDGYLP